MARDYCIFLRNKKSPEIVIETAITAQKFNTMIEGCYRVRQLMFKCVWDRDKGISVIKGFKNAELDF